MIADFWQKYNEAAVTPVAGGVERRLIYTDNLMLVVVDFFDGPTETPDPFHHHVHEQVSFISKGEILLFKKGNDPVHLKQGDMFAMEADVPHTIQRLTDHVQLVDCFTPIRNEFIND